MTTVHRSTQKGPVYLLQYLLGDSQILYRTEIGKGGCLGRPRRLHFSTKIIRGISMNSLGRIVWMRTEGRGRSMPTPILPTQVTTVLHLFLSYFYEFGQWGTSDFIPLLESWRYVQGRILMPPLILLLEAVALKARLPPRFQLYCIINYSTLI